MGWLGGLAGPWRCPRVAPGWPGGGLDRFYYPGTIRELSGTYTGFGWLGWGGRAGWARWERILVLIFHKEINHLGKKLII